MSDERLHLTHPTTVFQIPLQPQPQYLAVTMNGVDYNLRTHWCAPSPCWILDIADANNNPLINGIPILEGQNLLEQQQDKVPGYLEVGPANVLPDAASLGVTANLYYYPPFS